MLQNTRVTAFTFSELLRENQQGRWRGVKLCPPPRLGLISNIYIPKKVINLYFRYTLGPKLRNLKTDFTLVNCCFGSVKLTKNADLDKHKYRDYSIGFGPRSKFSLPEGTMWNDVIIFGVDMNLSVHVDNKGKDILILGEGPT